MHTATEIGLATGAVLNDRKVGKYFVIDIADGHFGFRRDSEKITAEARLDGLYVIHTSVPAEQLDASALCRIGLAHTQFAQATCGTIRLKLLKIGHW